MTLLIMLGLLFSPLLVGEFSAECSLVDGGLSSELPDASASRSSSASLASVTSYERSRWPRCCRCGCRSGTRLVYLSGVIELVLAAVVLVPQWRRAAGLVLIVMLIAFLPVNIYAAVNRVGMGGHEWGPPYLLRSECLFSSS